MTRSGDPDLFHDGGRLPALLDLVLSAETLEGFLTGLAHLGAESTHRRTSAVVALSPSGQLLAIASSDALAAGADEEQYRHGRGPSLEAFATGDVVRVPDLSADRRWPQFSARAGEFGIRTVMSLPLAEPDGTAVGTMTLYSPEPGPYDAEDGRRALRFAWRATGAVALFLTIFTRQPRTGRGVYEVLADRVGIDHAVGVLMAQWTCDPRTAFDLLRDMAQRRETTVRSMAAEILAGAEERRLLRPPAQDD